MSDTTIIVDLTDESGETIGRSIPIQIDYVMTVDQNYGADADGRNGVYLVEREILDKQIAVGDLLVMTSGQVERALAEAEEIFYERCRIGRV